MNNNLNSNELEMNDFKNIINILPYGVLILDENGVILFTNPCVSKLFTGNKFAKVGEIFGIPIVEDAFAEIDFNQSTSEPGIAELRLVKESVLWKDKKAYVCLVNDVTERKHIEQRLVEEAEKREQSQKELAYLALHDPLTGLANRRTFFTALDRALIWSARHHNRQAVVVLDLDKFKDINDTLGHNIGDQLLIQVASRLRKCLRDIDVLSRVGGDEFYILLDLMDENSQVDTILIRLLDSFKLPFEILGHRIAMSCSMGIRIFDSDNETAINLIRDADIALYRVKSLGRNAYQFFDKKMQNEMEQRLKIQSYLRRALFQNEFEVYYQPQLDVKNNEIKGLEALLRWNNDCLGMVSPSEFIPLLEESGQILDVGHWVLRQACEQVQGWIDSGYQPIKIAVNFSPVQLYHRDVVAIISSVLKETGLAPHLLDVEVTESILMRDIECATRVLHEIKSLGVNIVLDDFGTGYSSLAYLKHFPIDCLKIDQVFIRDLVNNQDDGNLVKAILAMSGALHLQGAIAEGVENSEQLKILQGFKCSNYQGFLYSKALPAYELETLLKLHT